MDLLNEMRKLGNLATRRQLLAIGFDRRVLEAALARNSLLRVRRGWVATLDANRIAVQAVVNGGRLTGATALRSYGVWGGMDLRIHVQVDPAGQRRVADSSTPLSRFAAPRFEYGEIVAEWSMAESPPPHHCAWRVSVADALDRFARREPAEQVIAAFESAVHARQISRTKLAEVIGRLPRRIRRMVERTNFLAESGLESIGRVRLEDLGYRVAQQVWIGRDRVDLVIDGWLVIEFDGDEWHDPVVDRRRTNRLIRAGYRVLRFGYFDIIEQWESTLDTIRALHGRPVLAVSKGSW